MDSAVGTLHVQPATLNRPRPGHGVYVSRAGSTSGGNPANGNYDLRFSVWTAVTAGSSVTGYVTNAPVAISNGLFTTTIDFGSGVFTGNPLWLQIGVRTNGSSGGYTGVSPRQQLTPAPYAVYSANAGSAATATTAASVPASAIGAGTANISITGNAATATTAAVAGASVNANYATASGTATTATNLIGNVADAQLSTNIARLNGTNTFTGTNAFAGVVIATNANNIIAGVFSGNGAALTNLNTAQFTGVVLTNNQAGVTLSGSITGNGASLTNVNAAALNGFSAMNFWQLGGNNVPSGQFLGSTNSQAVEIWVNNLRALRLEPTRPIRHIYSNMVNVVGGSPVNPIAPGVYGSVIGGGGGYYFGISNSQQYFRLTCPF